MRHAAAATLLILVSLASHSIRAAENESAVTVTETDTEPRVGIMTSIGLPNKTYLGLDLGYRLTEHWRARGGVSFMQDRTALDENAVQIGAQFLPFPKTWISPVFGLHYAIALGVIPFYKDRFSDLSLPGNSGRHTLAASLGVEFMPYETLSLGIGASLPIAGVTTSAAYLDMAYFIHAFE